MTVNAREVVRDGITGGASYDIEDDDKRVGRVDLVGPLPSGRRFWERYDGDDAWSREGECTANDSNLLDADLVIDIWKNR